MESEGDPMRAISQLVVRPGSFRSGEAVPIEDHQRMSSFIRGSGVTDGIRTTGFGNCKVMPFIDEKY